jgi:hypothetical protein
MSGREVIEESWPNFTAEEQCLQMLYRFRATEIKSYRRSVLIKLRTLSDTLARKNSGGNLLP